jgi:hypothetical protein
MTNMLMEFETLNRADVDEIMAGTFTVEGKKARLKDALEAHRKVPPPPPKPMMEPERMGPTIPDAPAQI